MTDLIFVPREEHPLLAESLRRLLPEASSPPPAWRSLWSELAESGALAVGLPEEEGGLDDARAAGIVAEQLGQRGALSPFIGASAVVARLLARWGDKVRSAEVRAAVADGTAIATLSVLSDEPLALVRNESGFALTGSRALVPFGAEADHFLVDALSPEGERVLVLAPRQAARIVRALIGIDDCPYADVTFEHVAIPAAHVIASGAEADRAWAWARDAYCATLCADAVGAMTTLVAMTGDYLKVRKQFGQALASYQVLQHRFVDMDMALTEARTVTEWVLGLIDGGRDDERRAAVLSAQFTVVRAATRVSQESVQLHGGIGMAQETPVGRYFKRLLTLPLLFGDEDSAAAAYAGI